MFRNLRTLLRYRGLIQTLVARDLKARYRGSVLGFFWSFINPLLLLAIYSWVFSTVLLQLNVEDRFRGRVFAAEAALTTLTMAASNYVVAELMDGFGFSPRVVTAGVGIFFLMPGLIWFLTRKRWDKREKVPAAVSSHEEMPSRLETEHIEI